MARKIVMLLLTLMLGFAGIASAGNVSSVRARIVARNWLTHVVHSYGSWGGDTSPAISSEESFVHNGVVVGYNFTVDPKGHILVSARDDIPAVKLYSETSTLSFQEEGLEETIAWISEEIFEVGEAIDTHGVEMAAVDPSQNPDRKLWAMLHKDPLEFARAAGEAATEAAVSYGPLLTTTWSQGDPYNQQCPLWSTGCRTIVGCVATAASQIMKYWNYPSTGQGSTSYSWYNGSTNVTLSRNFASSTYDWANMPNSVSAGSTPIQKSAVAKLSADVGVAFQMFYGCGGSGAYTSWAPSVFINYFKYQSTATWVNRASYANSSAWMKVFKAEVQAGRPSELSIQDPNKNAGHAVVVDGYRDSPSETVHINMGWGGSYDGWYIPESFTAGGYNWTSNQGAAIGIQPPSSAKCDFNGDGKTDILLSNTLTGDNAVWFMNGITHTGTAALPNGPSPSVNWKIAGVGDFNNDGKSDILVRNTSTGGVSVWLMNGITGTEVVLPYNNYSSAWTVGGIGDFNNDGKPDIIWRNTTSNEITIWYMDYIDGVIKRTGKYTFLVIKPAKEWKIEGVGDFNSDGQSDILLRNTSTSAIQIWFMEYINGVPTRTVKNALPYTAPSGWKIVGTGDFNNDVSTDILWWNSATGATSVWYMEGVARTGEVPLPTATVPVNWVPLN